MSEYKEAMDQEFNNFKENYLKTVSKEEKNNIAAIESAIKILQDNNVEYLLFADSSNEAKIMKILSHGSIFERCKSKIGADLTLKDKEFQGRFVTYIKNIFMYLSLIDRTNYFLFSKKDEVGGLAPLLVYFQGKPVCDNSQEFYEK